MLICGTRCSDRNINRTTFPVREHNKLWTAGNECDMVAISFRLLSDSSSGVEIYR